MVLGGLATSPTRRAATQLGKMLYGRVGRRDVMEVVSMAQVVPRTTDRAERAKGVVRECPLGRIYQLHIGRCRGPTVMVSSIRWWMPIYIPFPLLPIV